MSTSVDAGLPDACPHLGSALDADTRFAYPSEENWCYRVLAPEPVALEHQQRYCISGEYKTCPVLTRSLEKLPAQARQAQVSRIGGSLHWGWVLALTVVLIVLAGVAWQVAADSPPPPVATLPALSPLPSSTSTSTPLPSPTPVPASASRGETATPLPVTPSATFTQAPPTPGPGLETPFGPQERFLVHKVAVGESLGVIASRYATTVEVLRATNVFVPGTTLWAGQTLVILPGVQNVPEDVPPLLAVYLERDTTVTALARQYGVEEETLRAFNALGAGDEIPARRWVLIPQNQ